MSSKNNQSMEGTMMEEDIPYAPENPLPTSPEDLKHEDPKQLLKIIDALRKQLDDANARAEKNWDMALRAKAEGENMAKRLKLDVEAAHKFGSRKLLEELIPVLDTFEQACQVNMHPDSVSAMIDGVSLTMKLFVDTLAKQGVEQIDPLGLPFNPSQHEAISMQPSKDFAPNTVMQVFQKGYQLNGRLVRPARVIVSLPG